MRKQQITQAPAGRVSQQSQILKPDEAVALTERQWVKLIKHLSGNLPDGLYISKESEYYMCVPLAEDVYLPFAKIIIATVKEEYKDIKEHEKRKKAVIEALKKNRAFMRILDEYGSGKLVWVHEFLPSELKEIRGSRYPVFYVILNNSSLSTIIQIPM